MRSTTVANAHTPIKISRMAIATTGDCSPSLVIPASTAYDPPQVTNRRPMLPERYNECENTAGDQRQSQILRRMRMFGGADTGRLLQMLKELDDRKAKAD